ncbi:hypothetical protein [Streptomyces sp. ISL-43]|uniref:hypothetical protein n=1 Tax=Streptomyces sp. ISL-43 TaxID=2819183 RepID=UPI0027E3C43B|nr:hypothetical protein [Streptomyces sp. ISL-43]
MKLKRKRPFTLVAAAAALAFTLAACAGGAGESKASKPSATVISHIHGLGADPADGKLST